MNRFDLRPRTVGEVLDGAFRLYFANARTLITLVACVAVPLQVLWAVVEFATTSRGAQVPASLFSLHFHFARQPNGTLRDAAAQPSGASEAVDLIASTLTQVLGTAACVRALGDAVAGAQPSVGASIAEMARRLPALIVLYVVRGLGVAIGIILLIVPGVWLAGSWSVSAPALVLEGAGPGHALRRSAGLVRGRWWPVVAVVIVSDLVVAIVTGVVQALIGAVDGFSANPSLAPAVIAAAVGATIAALLIQPFNAAVRTVLYLDLRIRRGGEELQALAAQLGVDADG